MYGLEFTHHVTQQFKSCPSLRKLNLTSQGISSISILTRDFVPTQNGPFCPSLALLVMVT